MLVWQTHGPGWAGPRAALWRATGLPARSSRAVPLSGTPPPTGGRPAGRGRAPGPRQTSSGWLRLGSKRHLERCLGRHTDKLSPSRDGPGHIHYLPSAGGGDGQGAEAALLPRTLRPSPRGGRFSRKAPSPRPPPLPPRRGTASPQESGRQGGGLGEACECGTGSPRCPWRAR